MCCVAWQTIQEPGSNFGDRTAAAVQAYLRHEGTLFQAFCKFTSATDSAWENRSKSEGQLSVGRRVGSCGDADRQQWVSPSVAVTVHSHTPIHSSVVELSQAAFLLLRSLSVNCCLSVDVFPSKLSQGHTVKSPNTQRKGDNSDWLTVHSITVEEGTKGQWQGKVA